METKVRLSLSVPGANMLTQGECDKNPKDSYNTEVVSVQYQDKNGKLQRENIVVKTRKQKLIKQSINIPKEAYNYMTDPQAAPTDKLNKTIYFKKIIGKKPDGTVIRQSIGSTIWANYSLKQRLEWHLDCIADSLGAVNYTYEIFED